MRDIRELIPQRPPILLVDGLESVEGDTAVPPVGYIGEVKKFSLHRLPRVGETLHTTVNFGMEVAGVTLLSAETRIGEEVIAATQMKISMT